jgi:hypothetical protein
VNPLVTRGVTRGLTLKNSYQGAQNGTGGVVKMSFAPSFRVPGCHIYDVAAQGLEKHLFTAMLAQHVASELRMHL